MYHPNSVPSRDTYRKIQEGSSPPQVRDPNRNPYGIELGDVGPQQRPMYPSAYTADQNAQISQSNWNQPQKEQTKDARPKWFEQPGAQQYAYSEPGRSDNPSKGFREPQEKSLPIAPGFADATDDADIKTRKPKPKRWSLAWFDSLPLWVYLLSTIQIAVFIAELVKYANLTGSPIQVKPSVSWMLGPSFGLLVNMGARYQPCMHSIANVQNASVQIDWFCPNTTTVSPSFPNTCTLSDLCGMGGVPNPVIGGSLTGPAPNQWWRFITPIFIHAGFVHIILNLFIQIYVGSEVERALGHTRFFISYLTCGIFGFILGGNLSGNNQASVGCSGALLGLLALRSVKFCQEPDFRKRWTDALVIAADIAVTLVLGIFPGIDLYAHLGGLLMGFCLSFLFFRAPIKLCISPDLPARSWPWDLKSLKPGKARLIWTIVRILAFALIIILFVTLLENFYVWKRLCPKCAICVGDKTLCAAQQLTFTLNRTKRDLSMMRDL